MTLTRRTLALTALTLALVLSGCGNLPSPNGEPAPSASTRKRALDDPPEPAPRSGQGHYRNRLSTTYLVLLSSPTASLRNEADTALQTECRQTVQDDEVSEFCAALKELLILSAGGEVGQATSSLLMSLFDEAERQARKDKNPAQALRQLHYGDGQFMEARKGRLPRQLATATSAHPQQVAAVQDRIPDFSGYRALANASVASKDEKSRRFVYYHYLPRLWAEYRSQGIPRGNARKTSARPAAAEEFIEALTKGWGKKMGANASRYIDRVVIVAARSAANIDEKEKSPLKQRLALGALYLNASDAAKGLRLDDAEHVQEFFDSLSDAAKAEAEGMQARGS